MYFFLFFFFFFSSRRRHTRSLRDWSSDVCSSDLGAGTRPLGPEFNSASGRTRGGVGAGPCWEEFSSAAGRSSAEAAVGLLRLRFSCPPKRRLNELDSRIEVRLSSSLGTSNSHGRT